MPSLGIALRPGGCPDHAVKPGQDAAPVPGVVSGGWYFSSSGDWVSSNPAFAISRGSRDASRQTPDMERPCQGSWCW